MGEFTKDDIKLGMVVEFDNGYKALVIKHHNSPEEWLLVDRNGVVCSCVDFSQDLKIIDASSQWDIVAVYSARRFSSRLFENDLELVWKIREYTMDELTKILGHGFRIKG